MRPWIWPRTKCSITSATTTWRTLEVNITTRFLEVFCTIWQSFSYVSNLWSSQTIFVSWTWVKSVFSLSSVSVADHSPLSKSYSSLLIKGLKSTLVNDAQNKTLDWAIVVSSISNSTLWSLLRRCSLLIYILVMIATYVRSVTHPSFIHSPPIHSKHKCNTFTLISFINDIFCTKNKWSKNPALGELGIKSRRNLL